MQQTGEKAPGHASPRMVLVLALVLATAFGPVWLSPAGAASSVVSSDIIPLNGEVGGIRLSGVVHVVTQFVVNAGSDDISVFVHTYLTPSDVTAVDRQGNTYLAHGAGTAAISFHDYQDVPYYFPPMPGFVFVGSGPGSAGAPSATTLLPSDCTSVFSRLASSAQEHSQFKSPHSLRLTR